ncbi:MAG: acyl-CoA dehydrogenase domain protein [Aeromicrobium sp.]|nr:acyl-CoA dehydrogenase domain protein [Aeromicrobium sp.]
MTGTEIRDELATSVTRLLADRCDHEKLRARVASGDVNDSALFAELAAMGLVGLAISEERGGQGGELGDLVVALERLGATLAPVPLHSTSVALGLLDSCGDAAAEHVAAVIASDAPATVALSEGAGWGAEPQTQVSVGDGRATVSGTKHFVLDAEAARTYVVSAVLDGELALVVVLRDDDGVTVHPHEPLDLTRGIARVELADAPAAVVARGQDARRALRHGLDLAAVMLAAEQVGGSQACLDLASDYARTREQFGQPIGAFQGVSHRLADMFVQVSGARALVTAAAHAADIGDLDDFTRLAAAAQAYCADTFVSCAQSSIQVHGGIGFTWEHVAHLYLRRARSTEVVYGSPTDHRERLAMLSHSQKEGASS